MARRKRKAQQHATKANHLVTSSARSVVTPSPTLPHTQRPSPAPQTPPPASAGDDNGGTFLESIRRSYRLMTGDPNADEKSGFMMHMMERFKNDPSNDTLFWLVTQCPKQMGNVFHELDEMASDDQCTVDNMMDLLDAKERECRANFGINVHFPNYEVRDSTIRCGNGKTAGKGLFAKKDLPEHTFILMLSGDVYDDEKKVDKADGYSFLKDPYLDSPFPRLLNDGMVLVRRNAGFELGVCKAELRPVGKGNDDVECVVVGPDGIYMGSVSTSGAYLVVSDDNHGVYANDGGFDESKMGKLFRDIDISDANAAYMQRVEQVKNAVFVPILRATDDDDACDDDACDGRTKHKNYMSIGMGMVSTKPIACGDEILVEYGIDFWRSFCQDQYLEEQDDVRRRRRRRTEGRRSLPATGRTGRSGGAELPPGYEEVRHNRPGLVKTYSTFVRVRDGKTFKSAVQVWQDFECSDEAMQQ